MISNLHKRQRIQKMVSGDNVNVQNMGGGGWAFKQETNQNRKKMVTKER